MSESLVIQEPECSVSLGPHLARQLAAEGRRQAEWGEEAALLPISRLRGAVLGSVCKQPVVDGIEKHSGPSWTGVLGSGP